MRTPVSIGVVGMGERGSRLARAFDELPSTELRWLCDSSSERRLGELRRFPLVRWADDLDRLLEDDTLDAIAIATPPGSYRDLSMRALRAEKHVFVEPPLSHDSEEARAIAAEARARGRTLVVGDAAVHDPAVCKLRQYLHAGTLDDIYYIESRSQALGDARHRESVLWHLGPSALTLLCSLLGDHPIEVSARGDAYRHNGTPDIVFCYLRFATGIVATVHLSSLDPRPMNQVTVVGASGTAVVDYGTPERKLVIHQTSSTSGDTAYNRRIPVHTGDTFTPRLPAGDPVLAACEEFARSIGTPVPQALGGGAAVTVIEVLEALQRSLDAGGLGEDLEGPLTPTVEARTILVAVPTQPL